MNCLVTGATGHLGANLVRRLLRDGHKVRVLVQDPAAAENAAIDGLAVERVLGDIRYLDAMRAAVRGVSEVFHVAAKISTIQGGEREIYDINVLGTRNVLRAAREAQVRR